MKRLQCVWVMILVCFCLVQTAVFAAEIPDTPDLDSKAKAAVLIDADTGRVLFAKNANAELAMASTTKIMTSIIALDQPDLESFFTVDRNSVHTIGSSMALREGDQVTQLALVYGMMLPSGNDAANATAVHIAGSVEAFAEIMNEYASMFELENTHFTNPSGLDAAGHYSSAYDMALLMRRAMENPQFAEISSQSKASVPFGNPPSDRQLSNHNRLLTMYDYAISGKTGFTDDAGRCLVTCAEKDGIRLIAVTLNCGDDWNEHMKLYNHYFDRLRKTDLSAALSPVSLPVMGGTQTGVRAQFIKTGEFAFLEGESPRVDITVRRPLFAPISEGDYLGEAAITANGELIETVPLIAAQTVEVKQKKTLFEKIFGRDT